MPVYNQRDIIPFVNDLEAKLLEMEEPMESWRSEAPRIIGALSDIQSNENRAINAVVKADEALQELSTATFNVTAQRGQRLRTLIENLKDEMKIIAENSGGPGGSGGYYDERINQEINNAVAQVDPVVEDGLKLDYRLRNIIDIAMEGRELAQKEMTVPHVLTQKATTETSWTLDDIEGVRFIEGDVTVLSEHGEPVVNADGAIITGAIDDKGQVTMSHPIGEEVKLYFPVEVEMQDMGQDTLYLMMDMLVKKNSQYMQDILTFKTQLDSIHGDIEAMKGENWTADFSIMRNYEAIVKEGLTPKGLHVDVSDGVAKADFSYTDHEFLSHWILEKWDEEEQKFVPYDDDLGVIYK